MEWINEMKGRSVQIVQAKETKEIDKIYIEHSQNT